MPFEDTSGADSSSWNAIAVKLVLICCSCFSVVSFFAFCEMRTFNESFDVLNVGSCCACSTEALVTVVSAKLPLLVSHGVDCGTEFSRFNGATVAKGVFNTGGIFTASTESDVSEPKYFWGSGPAEDSTFVPIRAALVCTVCWELAVCVGKLFAAVEPSKTAFSCVVLFPTLSEDRCDKGEFDISAPALVSVGNVLRFSFKNDTEALFIKFVVLENFLRVDLKLTGVEAEGNTLLDVIVLACVRNTSPRGNIAVVVSWCLCVRCRGCESGHDGLLLLLSCGENV